MLEATPHGYVEKFIDMWDSDKDPDTLSKENNRDVAKGYRGSLEEVQLNMAPLVPNDIAFPVEINFPLVEWGGIFVATTGAILAAFLMLNSGGKDSGGGVFTAEGFTAIAGVGQSIRSFAAEKSMHTRDFTLSKHLHEKDKHWDVHLQNRDHRVALTMQRRDQILTKKIHMIQMYIDLAQNELSLAHDLLLALNEAIRDIYDASNQKLQTLILSSAVMFAALSTVLIQGQLPDSSIVSPPIIWVMAGAGAISFSCLFFSIVVCIELLNRLSVEMQSNAKMQIIELSGLTDSDKQKSSERNPLNFVDMKIEDIQEHWKSHEETMEKKLKAIEENRKNIKKHSDVDKLLEFWDVIETKTLYAEFYFYIGTILMLVCTADFCFAEFSELYSDEKFYPLVVGCAFVLTIGLSLIGALIYLQRERRHLLFEAKGSKDDEKAMKSEKCSHHSSVQSGTSGTILYKQTSQRSRRTESTSLHREQKGDGDVEATRSTSRIISASSCSCSCAIDSEEISKDRAAAASSKGRLLRDSTFADEAGISVEDVRYLLEKKLIVTESLPISFWEGGTGSEVASASLPSLPSLHRIRESNLKQLDDMLVSVNSVVSVLEVVDPSHQHYSRVNSEDVKKFLRRGHRFVLKEQCLHDMDQRVKVIALSLLKLIKQMSLSSINDLNVFLNDKISASNINLTIRDQSPTTIKQNMFFSCLRTNTALFGRMDLKQLVESALAHQDEIKCFQKAADLSDGELFGAAVSMGCRVVTYCDQKRLLAYDLRRLHAQMHSSVAWPTPNRGVEQIFIDSGDTRVYVDHPAEADTSSV